MTSLKLLCSAQLLLSLAQLLHDSCQTAAVICSGQQLPPAGYVDPSDTRQVLMALRGSSSGYGAGLGGGRTMNQQDQTQQGDENSIVKFCPDRCLCNFTIANQLQVTCDSHFNMDFPITALRKDIEVLKIVPRCAKYEYNHKREGRCLSRRENILNLGPHFRYLRLLKVLVITDSQIPNLGTKTLILLGSLRVLDLSRNRLTALIDKNFEGLHALKEIYLDGNLIKSMISAAFRFVPQLEILSLRNNRITELAPRIFYKLKNLKYLDLSGNLLEHFDGGVFQDTPSLETLACEGCGLFQFSVPDAYRDRLNNLDSLFLANNTFRRLTDISTAMTENLQVFDLSRNSLNVLDALNSSRLQTLNLERNNISRLAGCALCNTSLQNLNLGYNKVVRVSLNILPEEVKSMQALSLSGNWIDPSSLRDLLEKFPTLEVLDLDHTGLVNIPNDLFYANHALRRLNLSQNLLIDLDPQVFRHLSRLESLDLSHNFLMGLSDAFFAEVEDKKRLRMVYLQSNQWKCDQCHIKPLLRFLRSSLMYWGSCFKPNSPLCLKCYGPDEFKYKHLEDLNAEDESLPSCEPHYQQVHFGVRRSRGSGIWNTNSPYYALGIILFIVVAVVAATSMRYRHYGVYLTHESNSAGGLVDGGGGGAGADGRQPNDEEEILRDPVVVLDRNAESYINLKYPILPTDPASMEQTKEVVVTQPLFSDNEGGQNEFGECDTSFANASYLLAQQQQQQPTATSTPNSNGYSYQSSSNGQIIMSSSNCNNGQALMMLSTGSNNYNSNNSNGHQHMHSVTFRGITGGGEIL